MAIDAAGAAAAVEQDVISRQAVHRRQQWFGKNPEAGHGIVRQIAPVPAAAHHNNMAAPVDGLQQRQQVFFQGKSIIGANSGTAQTAGAFSRRKADFSSLQGQRACPAFLQTEQALIFMKTGTQTAPGHKLHRAFRLFRYLIKQQFFKHDEIGKLKMNHGEHRAHRENFL